MRNVKRYTLDTNVFRYKAAKGLDKTLKYESRVFWRKVMKEIADGEATLLIPNETKKELEVQSYGLGDSQNAKIDKLIKLCSEVYPHWLTNEMEHTIRLMQAYVLSNFGQYFIENGTPIRYAGVSDTRIFYTALSVESILVTANIRDFMLYPLLRSNEDDVLYDIKINQFVRIPEKLYITIHDDADFNQLLNHFYELENNAIY